MEIKFIAHKLEIRPKQCCRVFALPGRAVQARIKACALDTAENKRPECCTERKGRDGAMLAVCDVWDNPAFFDALGGGSLQSAITVTRMLMLTSKSACKSNMMHALGLHLQKQTTTRDCTPVLTSNICSILFVLRRFQKQCAAVYAGVFERLMAQMPYMYTPDTHPCMRSPLHAFARKQYKDARVFDTMLREFEASCDCEAARHIRAVCFHLLCKSVVVLDGKHNILLDFCEQSAPKQARFCQAVCVNLANITKGSNLEIGVLCALEAIASVGFSSVILYTLIHEFSLAVCMHDSFRVQMLHGSLARVFTSTNDVLGMQQYVLDNDILGHALLLYHTHYTVHNEGLHVAMCSLLWQLVVMQRRVLPAHFQQMLQIFCTMDSTPAWPTTVMLMVLRLVATNYKCDFSSKVEAHDFVLAVKNLCMRCHDACVLADGVMLLRTVDEEGMLDDHMLKHVEPVLAAFTHATLAAHGAEPMACGVLECGYLYARIVQHADQSSMQRIAPDVALFLCMALSNSARGPWRMSCRHIDLGVRMCRGLETFAEPVVASIVATFSKCAESMARHLDDSPTRLVTALISAAVFIGSRTPLHANAEINGYRALLVKLACCRHSQASIHRVYRLFVVSCPTHMCINELPFKETLVTRLVTCRINKPSVLLQISSMLLTVHTCNKNLCLCSNFTPGTCQGVLKWCVWGILHTHLSPASAYNIFSLLGLVTRSAAQGCHKSCAGRQLATDLRTIMIHADAAVLHKHGIAPLHAARL